MLQEKLTNNCDYSEIYVNTTSISKNETINKKHQNNAVIWNKEETVTFPLLVQDVSEKILYIKGSWIFGKYEINILKERVEKW